MVADTEDWTQAAEWWYSGKTPDQIRALLAQDHARLVALRP